jgi:hypothetical protein
MRSGLDHVATVAGWADAAELLFDIAWYATELPD